jgi:hypothetical protein
MAAVVRASYFGGNATEPAGANAETGIKWNREDSQTGSTTPIPVPLSAGTNYSWIKNLALEVTTIASPATSITNRNIKLASAPSAGLTQGFKAAAYAQPASGNKPADNGTTNDAIPATYTQITTSNQLYDNASVSGGTLGRNGSMVLVYTGISFLFTGGGGTAIALPNLQLTYDEA